jgi:triosephosphate isomerase (TIM)
MQSLILANWKANLNPTQVEQWLAEFLGLQANPTVDVVLAVPDLCLQQARKVVSGHRGLRLAAQGISPFPVGSYTGSTPASWLRGLVDYALIGHRERRRYFHESIQEVAAQVREAVSANIRPILCCTREEVGPQLSALEECDLEQILLAYTPDDAEGLEIVPSRAQIAKVVAEFSRQSGGRPVLYGGGVHGDNCRDLLQIDGVTGLLVGRDSLTARGFNQLLRNAV